MPADRTGRGRRRIGQAEAQIGRPDPVDQQGDGGCGQRFGRRRHLIARHRQQRQAIDLFTDTGQWLPAGREEADRRCLRQHEFDERRHDIDDLLAIIEHDQKFPRLQPARQQFGRLIALELDAQCRGDMAGNQRRILQHREIDEDGAVAVPAGDRRDDLECEARLADAARTRQRHQPRLIQDRLDRGQIRLAAEQGG
ncbi:MAG: hypothetical protein WDN69_13365 [Aliidongia sp.]